MLASLKYLELLFTILDCYLTYYVLLLCLKYFNRLHMPLYYTYFLEFSYYYNFYCAAFTYFRSQQEFFFSCYYCLLKHIGPRSVKGKEGNFYFDILWSAK